MSEDQKREITKNETNEVITKATEFFHHMYYNGLGEPRVWEHTLWLGYQVFKTPFDLWVYQEIINELRPDVIVETGIARGGSVAYLLSICRLVGKGEVVGVDIEITPQASHLANVPDVTLLKGSSTDPGIVQQVKDIIRGRSALVILDSDHARDHVLEEMRLYSEFVPVGGYMIVEDSNVNGHPIKPEHGPGPYEAIEAFLAECDDFEIDKSREKYYLTFNPNGYLRRIK